MHSRFGDLARSFSEALNLYPVPKRTSPIQLPIPLLTEPYATEGEHIDQKIVYGHSLEFKRENPFSSEKDARWSMYLVQQAVRLFPGLDGPEDITSLEFGEPARALVVEGLTTAHAQFRSGRWESFSRASSVLPLNLIEQTLAPAWRMPRELNEQVNLILSRAQALRHG